MSASGLEGVGGGLGGEDDVIQVLPGTPGRDTMRCWASWRALWGGWAEDSGAEDCREAAGHGSEAGAGGKWRGE